jgi:hypothetical protein
MDENGPTKHDWKVTAWLSSVLRNAATQPRTSIGQPVGPGPFAARQETSEVSGNDVLSFYFAENRIVVADGLRPPRLNPRFQLFEPVEDNANFRGVIRRRSLRLRRVDQAYEPAIRQDVICSRLRIYMIRVNPKR